ncbi:choice-of-anchor B family protein [Marinirhabdus gelatinilytica]|uniref:Choice-of-anchor B domain-containing protein n=1 Tax=Marinirhabdus gelatinilytica TaxID=1703343 RepID=A0A370QJG7_9FLAO|nr:choice-of-anchor B family protein [Marinirhabdus gelatinilytica]RDK88220.1 choice-of-anchor B domain-containing protein [Marinirhabdus gelatinilytica]
MKKIVLFCLASFILIGCSEDDDNPIATLPEDPMEDPLQDPPPPPPPLTFPAPCDSGLAGGIFPCNGIDLVYHIDLDELDAEKGNDSWGWTDPITGKEYALMGLDNGTAFIDISNPSAPIYLGKLETETSASSWRDIKVFKDHAFVVSEAQGHGMQVFDLTRLRDVTNPPQNFSTDAEYTGFGSAHNIVINEDSGFAYAVGTQTFDGGPHFIDINDPTNPQGAGGYAMGSYSHDAQVVTYNGPDTEYTGREILIGSNENEVVLVDITDKANPVPVSTISYDQVGYTHQGWFTEDQSYFLLGDELDELNFGFGSRTIVFDFTDLDNPMLHFEYDGPTAAIDHNGYVNGDRYYLANYTAGLRIIDVSGIGNGSISEMGSFDSFTQNNNPSFNGAWSVFPYFDSGHIIISDIDSGFYLVKPTF